MKFRKLQEPDRRNGVKEIQPLFINGVIGTARNIGVTYFDRSSHIRAPHVASFP
jgi:hypothetical protein